LKIKYPFLAVLFLLLTVSISQIFSIPPFAADIFGVYKSGYFRELDRGFEVIREAFIATKMYSRPENAWILLEDMRTRQGIAARVYNASGYEVTAPGQTGPQRDARALAVINSISPAARSSIEGGKYISIMPVFMEERCGFCHAPGRARNLIGVLAFERDYDAHIYYSAERIIIFCAISMALCLLVYLVLRWDPERRVKELFDKS
jgi:hypothetical protein